MVHLIVMMLLLGTVAYSSETPKIKVLEINSLINPFTARFLRHQVNQAAGADLILIRLDTPGGLETSMRQMTQDILESPVPVAVYVAPSGARAASAGMFLVIAAHVAAMAPGTNIGAAHPVAMGGTGDEVQKEKAVNDAAALARAVAEKRGRNAVWVERAVRESLSMTADEALRKNVIDLVADDMRSLLNQLNDHTVLTRDGEVRLQLAFIDHGRASFTGPHRPKCRLYPVHSWAHWPGG
jgi:membrane-bound serine protease (ClpP class)